MGERMTRLSFGHAVAACGLALAALGAGGCSSDPTAKYLDTGLPREDGMVAAAARGDADAVRQFMASGLAVGSQDQHGSTPLMAAAGAGRH